MFSPQNLVTRLGMAYYRRRDRPFGIQLRDRLQHLYVVGQTGTGKSTLLASMARQDGRNLTGFCLLDPHGDLAFFMSKSIETPHIYWDISDPDSPYGYNPLTAVSPELRPLVASGFIETLKKQWADAWGARMEHLLRYAVLALLETPSATLADIMPLFTNRSFRAQVRAQITDAEVKRFWEEEYPAMNYKTAFDGVAPIANKLGAFLAHPVLRKALCEPEKPLRLRQIMDSGQILIVNLARGKIGADLSNVMGGLILSNISNAAYSRQNVPENDRRPFMVLVDEFHNFTTQVIANSLSELRKYGVGMTLCQQFLSQSDKAVRDAILGNAGSLITFRVGPSDTALLSRYLQTVSERDLLNLPNYQAFIRLMIEGVQSRTFSMTSIPPDIGKSDT